MPPQIAELIEQLAKIGNNLNQIAKKANSDESIDKRQLELILALLRMTLLSVKS